MSHKPEGATGTGAQTCAAAITTVMAIAFSLVDVNGQGASFHAVFDKWSATPHVVRAHSLRDQAQINRLVCGSTSSDCPRNTDWSYDSAADMGRLMFNPRKANQLRVVLPSQEFPRTASGSVTLYWRQRIPANVDRPFLSLLGKMYQITMPETPNMRYLEMRFVPDIGCGIRGSVKLYSDGLSFSPAGPGATAGSGTRGPNTAFGDALQPQVGRMAVACGVTTSFIAHIDHTEETFPGVAGGRGFDRFSLWTWDRERGFVQVYDRLAVLHRTAILGFWFEYSGMTNVQGLTGPYYAWNDDFLLLRDAPISEFLNDVNRMGGLGDRQIQGPAAPRSLRIHPRL
jgi:hypothetical protein